MGDNISENLYFSITHEWVRLETDATLTIGVTDYSQKSIGDMVYIDLPKVGNKQAAQSECAVLESAQAAADFCTPIAGEIVAVNQKLTSTPQLINKDPYGDGWIIRLRPKDPKAITKLMRADAYQKYLAAEEEGFIAAE